MTRRLLTLALLYLAASIAVDVPLQVDIMREFSDYLDLMTFRTVLTSGWMRCVVFGNERSEHLN